MANHVYWLIELEMQPGKEQAVQALMKELTDATRAHEPGALTFEWNTSADGTRCHLYERYADSDAAMTHLTRFGQQFAGRFLEMLKPTRFVVYGAPSQQVKEGLAVFSPVYMTMREGFHR
jgi:quinol monooxygenase YgiN